MLNHFFITRDAPSFLSHYLSSLNIALPVLSERIDKYSKGKTLLYEQWWQLLDELDDCLKQEALGVRIGASIGTEQCGLLGYLFRTSPSLLDALACYQRYEELLYAGSKVNVVRTSESLTLTWPSDHGLSRQLSDSLLLTSLVNIIREVLNDPLIIPSTVAFAHPIPAGDRDCYEIFFGCKPLEQQQNLSIEFKLDDLEKAIPFHDKTLHNLLGQQADALVEQLPSANTTLENIKKAIGQGLHQQRFSADSVARAMNISNRTLHRQLKHIDTRFRDILRDVRKRLAQSYLADDSLSISEVALLLGYSEQSAFNRAHKTWFGMTPKQHRAKLNAQQH